MHNYPQLPSYEKDPKKLIKLRNSSLLLNLSLSNSGVFNHDILRNNNKNDDDYDINDDSSKPYPLIRYDPLGRGSSSVVYRSILLDSLTVCAEKVIVSSDTNKKGLILRELKSLQIATQTNQDDNKCENIVKLLKVVPNPYDGTLSICLEMMDGGSLQDLVNEGGCQDELILYRILQQMLKGLQFLHSLRLLHRDLKPSNALISSKGIVKLADFGISRTLEDGNSLAESFVGTLDYMAPERMIGQPYSYSSDVWALGLTIHSLALGSYPYEIKERGFWSLLNAIQNTTIVFPPSLSFSTEFINFLTKSCDKDPLKRPSSSELLLLVTNTLDKMESNNIDDSIAQLREPESIEVAKKKVIKKESKTIKMKESYNSIKKTSASSKLNNNTSTTNNTNTAIPSAKSMKTAIPSNSMNVKESTNNHDNKTEKKKSVITTNSLHTNTEKTHINTDSSNNNNNTNSDKENHGITNFRKKINKYHSKYLIVDLTLLLILLLILLFLLFLLFLLISLTLLLLLLLHLIGKLKNITSMCARDAFKLASAWKTYVTEKIGLLDDDDGDDGVKEEIYNNPAPNISINSIDTLANELNCSKTLMRGAFFTVITTMKELSTAAILEDGRIKVYHHYIYI